MHFQQVKKDLKNRKNFAGSNNGASVLSASRGIKAKSAILSNSEEQYLILPECNNKRKNELIVSLSDDVSIDTILVSSQEDFSASLAEITFYGSVEPPIKNQWTTLGSVIPE